MRLTKDFIIGLCYIILVSLVSTKAAFFKKMYRRSANNVQPSSGQNIIQFDREAYPQPIPTQPEQFILSPYTTIYQGIRYDNDTRVYRKRFAFEPLLSGQQVVCEGLFDCIISHLAIESTEAIPVLLRGGAGYRHFMAIIKAKPGYELKGQVRAYCRGNYKPEESPKELDTQQGIYENGASSPSDMQRDVRHPEVTTAKVVLRKWHNRRNNAQLLQESRRKDAQMLQRSAVSSS